MTCPFIFIMAISAIVQKDRQVSQGHRDKKIEEGRDKSNSQNNIKNHI